jgi:hypothetical protein
MNGATPVSAPLTPRIGRGSLFRALETSEPETQCGTKGWQIVPEPERIEFEAIGFRVFAEEHLGFVVVEIATALDATVALRVRRSTFDDLVEQLTSARSERNKRAPGE